MLSQDFLELLRCPLNHGPLRIADDEFVAQINLGVNAGTVKNRVGEVVHDQLDGALIDEGRTIIYPVYDGIPCLLVDESISVDDLRQAGDS